MQFISLYKLIGLMMKTHRYLLPAILFLSLHTSTTQASQDQQTSAALWQDITSNHQARLAQNNATNGQRRTLLLNTKRLQQLIDDKTVIDQSGQSSQPHVVIEVPLPDGDNATVELRPTNTLSTELQHLYPSIKTWRVNSSHPGIVSGRAELTPGGFHIILQSNNGEQWLTEPALNSPQQDTPYYQSYRKRQNDDQQKQPFNCSTRHTSSTANTPASSFKQHISYSSSIPEHTNTHYAQRQGEQLLSYDLAISATAEYTRQFDGSVLKAYSAIVSTINRVNAIYERELGITFQLVSGTETVFTDPASDPFNGASPLVMLERNQQLLDTSIGGNNYDLGHVFSVLKQDTGISSVASLCQSSRKAQGLSAAKTLLDDRFIVDYVAHELGHQLGATHTFNSTLNACGGSNRAAETAFEPGSGSTIMSYAGLCDSDNIQQQAIPRFHSESIAQIKQTINTIPAAACGKQIALANNPPTVTASSDFVIPARTPFILNGLASDRDGDKLSYGWDQTDAGDASSPGIDMGNNALIKSSPLSNTAVRYVPDISDLLNKDQTVTNGESLPPSARELNFRLSTRDGHGAVSTDDLKITVFDTGYDFRISYPTSSLDAGSHAIHWRVAYTNQPPINCTHVDIAYTNDQGATFTDLIRNTPNDGGALIKLNEVAKHIRVKCSNNTFFTLSGTQPHIAGHPTTGQQAPFDAGKNEADNGGGGTVSFASLLLGGIFAILLSFRGRKKCCINTAG